MGVSRGGFDYREKIDQVTPETCKNCSHRKLEEPGKPILPRSLPHKEVPSRYLLLG